jgi:hypothetical protein
MHCFIPVSFSFSGRYDIVFSVMTAHDVLWMKGGRMNITTRRLLTFSLISFLLCGCQNRPAQEPEETAPPVEEATPEPAETAAPTPEPEPTPFDISGVKWILIGDSLTDKTMAAQVSYYDFVQKDFQCEVVNCGRSSTGYMIAPDYETFYQRIDLIDFTDELRQNLANRLFRNRISTSILFGKFPIPFIRDSRIAKVSAERIRFFARFHKRQKTSRPADSRNNQAGRPQIERARMAYTARLKNFANREKGVTRGNTRCFI